MFINGKESLITAGPISSSPVMLGRLEKGGQTITVEFIAGTEVAWVKDYATSVWGIVVGPNKIKLFENGMDIEIPFGSDIKARDGNVFKLIKGIGTDIAYTALDLREMNARLYKNGFIKRFYADKKNFFRTNGLNLEIGATTGMVDGLVFSTKRPTEFVFKQGGEKARIDSLVAGFSSETNRFEIRIEEGKYPEDGKNAESYVPKENHLGTYELKICDVFIAAYATDIDVSKHIVDMRHLIEDFNADDIQFVDSIDVIEDGVPENMQNAIYGLNSKVEKHNTERKKADDEFEKRFNELSAEEVLFEDKNTNLFPPTAEPPEETKTNVQLAIEKLNDKIEDVKNNSGSVSDDIKEAIQSEAKIRAAEDAKLAAEDAKLAAEDLAIRAAMKALKAENIGVDINSLPGLLKPLEETHIQNAIIALFKRILALEAKVK